MEIIAKHPQTYLSSLHQNPKKPFASDAKFSGGIVTGIPPLKYKFQHKRKDPGQCTTKRSIGF